MFQTFVGEVKNPEPAGRFLPWLVLTLAIFGCSGSENTLFTLISLGGQELPTAPGISCCNWRGGTIDLDGGNYRFVLRTSNKTGGGSFLGGGSADPNEVFTSEEEGSFSLNGTTLMFDRIFSTFPDVRLVEMRLEGDEILGTITVALAGTDESHAVVFRR